MSEELLYVDPDALSEEQSSGIKFCHLTEEARSHHEVIISQGGQFIHKLTGEPVDTGTMIAHGKRAYAAYVLTRDGRLFLFNHLDGRDQIGHTSMSGGEPVMGSGEMIIDEGELKLINNHSGHYKPSLFSIKRVLAYFQGKSVDLVDVTVETFCDPKTVLKHLPSERVGKSSDDEMFHTPAMAILQSLSQYIDSKTEKLVEKFDAQEYSWLTRFYRMLEKRFSFTKGLTDERNALRQAFKDASFAPASPNTSEIDRLKDKIRLADNFIKSNNALSKKYEKKENSGRFYTEMLSYKQSLEKRFTHALKAGLETPTASYDDSKMKKLF